MLTEVERTNLHLIRRRCVLETIVDSCCKYFVRATVEATAAENSCFKIDITRSILSRDFVANATGF